MATQQNMSRTRSYKAWSSMLRRTTNPKSSKFKTYKRWCPPDDWFVFENFYLDMGECPEGLTLDRIDNNKPYGPNNCRWATRDEQQRNTTRNIWLKHPVIGVWVLKDACALMGLNRTTVNSRLHKLNWSPAEALGSEWCFTKERP